MRTGGIDGFMVVGIIATFLWIGFVCAISFMEAWLKLTAPGVSVSIGLSIGRIVFKALNMVEWIFAIILLVHVIIQGAMERIEVVLLICIFILLLQTFWLLPALDHRSELIIAGQQPGASLTHYYYVIAEVTKVVCLFVYGLKLIIRNNANI